LSYTRLAVSEWDSGDHKFLSARGVCAPRVMGGQRFRAAVHHRTEGHVRMVAYFRRRGGDWRWWGQSPPLDTRDGWTWSHWETPALPDDAVALQIGISLRSEGWSEVRYLTLEPFEPRPPAACGSAPLGGLLLGLVGRRVALALRPRRSVEPQGLGEALVQG